MTQETETKRLKREILIRIIRAFYSDNFKENTRLIPYEMRPKGSEVSFRCCIHKERAIVRSRVIAGLGGTIENDDERILLSSYAEKALARKRPDQNPITLLETACQGCPDSRIFVTDLCQNCIARPCINACKFGAISNKDGRSVVDQDKCKKCGLCMNACPYHAIAKTVVPCENVCPVGAITKSDNGYAQIDFNKCISCGKCVSACPFGAVHAKCQLIDVLNKFGKGQPVIAMIAPAIMGQFDCDAEQLHSALLKVGFDKVIEVAQGADITIQTEAHDFKTRMEEGHPFMTTSCCAAYKELVLRHMPEIKKYVSETQTPLYYTAELVKKEHPDAITVFLSPCFAKRKEVYDNPNVDYVLNFEEISAIFQALDMDLKTLEKKPFPITPSCEAKNFPIRGGVSKAVQNYLKKEGIEELAHPCLVCGLTKESVRELRRFAKTGVCPEGNLIEVMSCEGGCIGGNATLNPIKQAFKQVTEYSDKSPSLLEDI